MKLFRKNQLYSLFLLLSKKRKKQIYFLIFLIIVNGIFESLSISAIIPFLTLIVSKGEVEVLDNFIKFLPFENTTSSELLLLTTVLFCLFIFLSTFLRIINHWYIFSLTAKIDIDISNLIFKKNIYQTYSDYTKKSSSKIISLLVEKVTASASAINSIFTILLSSIVASSIIISLLFFNWKIVLTSFLFLYFFYLLVSRKVRKSLSINGEILSFNTPIRIKIIQEAFNGFRDIVINNTEKIYFNLFNKYNSIIKLKNAKSQLYIISPKFLIEGISLLLIAISGYFLSISNSTNYDFIPTIGAFVYALQRLLPLTQQTYAAWAGYKVKAPSIRDVLAEIKKVGEFEIKHVRNFLKYDKEINLKKISYSYGESNSILRDINLKIYKGDHIGIYGETGSGKSTFLDLIMGLLPPNKGEILIDGIDIYKNNLQYSWTSKISHVPQNIFLKEASIAENIAFGVSEGKLNLNLLKKASKISNIYKFIEQTEDGFQTMVGERGVRLSGGQRQRIAIARAIYQSREILVLDEATSALDEETENTIIDSILKNYLGLTIIMVTHRIKSLQKFKRVLKVTSNGNIIES